MNAEEEEGTETIISALRNVKHGLALPRSAEATGGGDRVSCPDLGGFTPN